MIRGQLIVRAISKRFVGTTIKMFAEETKGAMMTTMIEELAGRHRCSGMRR